MRKRLTQSLIVSLVLALLGMPLVALAGMPSADDHDGCCLQMQADKAEKQLCDNDREPGHDCSGACADCINCAHSFSNVYTPVLAWGPGLPDAQPVAILAAPEGLTPTVLYRPPRV